ncbi:MAG: MBL fold metallo-hydrolase [Planctomycetota bacterium]
MSAGVAATAALPAWAISDRSRRDEPVLPWENPRDGAYISDQRTDWGGNVVVLAGGDGNVLVIDAKYTAYSAAIRHDAEIVGGKTVHFVNTHHHGDHTGGNVTFVGEGRSYGHEALIPRVENQFRSYRRQIDNGEEIAGRLAESLVRYAASVRAKLHTYDATSWVPENAVPKSGTTLDVGGLEVRLAHQGPGHTDNDLIVHCPEKNIIHAGDLIFAGLNPFIDRNGGASARSWVKSLELIESMCDADTIVIPGHGKKGGVEIVRAQRSYLENLLEEVQKKIDAGASRDEVVEATFGFQDGLGFGQIRGRANAAVYDELTQDNG